jgi:hypothetical protein
MRTVFLILKEGNKTSSKAIKVNDVITLDKSFIDMSDYLGKETVCALIHFKDKQISQLSLTKVSPYTLLFFDEFEIYKGATHSINNQSGSFSIQTQYKYILFIRMPHNLTLNNIMSLNTEVKKYKYLNYVPAPVYLKPHMYDLVNDEEFCTPDGRTPLLMVIQYGIFPIGHYEGTKDYSRLEGLENQKVGFIGRGYLSNRERKNIIEIFLDKDTIKQIRSKAIEINLNLWNRIT